MMMLKMMNPMGSMPSVPGTGDDKEKEDSGLTREEIKEQERLRKEAIMHTEKQRHLKYKKQEEERESVRQNLRDKYKLEKPQNEEESEEEDEDDSFGAKKKEDDDDPVAQAQKLAEKQLNDAKALAQEKCVLQ
eukprot:GFUD01021926.1.p1 GENE.GFUD01021926.1~~GFUD01021926.1.p1  ORF type:complete len:133 (-),score=69.57 GFUD01021926.1:196-594(-)